MRRVVEEIRTQSTPDLDWDRMERELLSEIDRGQKLPYPMPGRSSALLRGERVGGVRRSGGGEPDHAFGRSSAE
jgi:hypothetical protein